MPENTTPTEVSRVANPAPSANIANAKLRRADNISVKLSPNDVAVLPQEATVLQPPLSQERLEEVWKLMLTSIAEVEPRLFEHLKDRKVKMVEEDVFELYVDNSYIESEIKMHLIRMLTYLRKKSGRPELNCLIKIVVVEKESRPYSARDKYDAMVKENKVLETMRIIFPDVEM